MILDTKTMLNIQENISLSQYSTMRLGGPARYLCEISEKQQIPEALAWAEQQNLSTVMIGGGSNIIWGDAGFSGLVLVNTIEQFEIYDLDNENSYVTIGAGINWDSAVERSVELGYSGIEFLSLIPGTAGATPIQNVGAYGREIKDILTTLEAYDAEQKTFVTLRGDECNFAYRTSRFKSEDKGRFYIVSLTLHLTKRKPQPPFYATLQHYLDEHKINDYSPQTIRDAVIAIRSSKLPNPAEVANNGSFFFNPIVDQNTIQTLISNYPNMPYWHVESDSQQKAKISAAWLVEQAGFKDIHDQETGMATWHKQPLVLVNEHATSTKDLVAFRDKIMTAVEQKFGIRLQQEPELIA